MARWLAAAVDGEIQSVGLELLEKTKPGRARKSKKSDMLPSR
jgi:hypothetical protein